MFNFQNKYKKNRQIRNENFVFELINFHNIPRSFAENALYYLPFKLFTLYQLIHGNKNFKTSITKLEDNTEIVT